MATLQEFRQKYPQYDDMSDEQLAGALHKKFYSDMPYDEFSAKIGLGETDGPTDDQTVQPAERPHDVATIANRMYELGPAESAKRIAGGLVDAGRSLATGIVESAKDAYSAPYRAYTGELPMTDDTGRTSQQAIDEAANMAMWANPTSIASGTGNQIARNAALEAAKRPPSEGALVAQAARDIGVTLPRAVTSDSAAVNQIGKTVANVPIAGQPLRKASKEAISQMDDAAKRVQDKLGSGDRLLAGEQVRAGVQDFGKNVLGARIQAMEDDLAKTVNPETLNPLSKTKALVADIQKERYKRATSKPSKAIAEIEEALSRDGLSFDGLRAKRAEIRQIMNAPVNADDLTTGGYNKAEFERLYSALTEDLRAAALRSGGPNGLKKFDETVKAEFAIAREREALTKVLGNNLSDEALSDKLFRMAGDKSTANYKDLMRVRSAVSKDTWNELSSSVLSRIGRDAEGRFTPDRFVTSWGGLSDGGKKLLFEGETRKALDDIATVSSRFKKLNEYANPSGTSQSAIAGGFFPAIYVAPMSTISGALTANVTARMLAKPASARAIADYSKAYEAAVKLPGTATQNALAKKAQALALIAANGNERAASNLAARLATIQQTAADTEDDEQVGGPEGNPEAAKASNEFNDAYLQGRAF